MRNAYLSFIALIAISTGVGCGLESVGDDTVGSTDDTSSVATSDDRVDFNDMLEADGVADGTVCWQNTDGDFGADVYSADDSDVEGVDTFFDHGDEILDAVAIDDGAYDCGGVTDNGSAFIALGGFGEESEGRFVHLVTAGGERGLLAVVGRNCDVETWSYNDQYDSEHDDNDYVDANDPPTDFGDRGKVIMCR